MRRMSCVALAVLVCLTIAAPVQPTLAQSSHTPISGLAPEEAGRLSQFWTLEQIAEKGWTPYDCFGTSVPTAPVGTRWPTNDGAGIGTCVTYSFMADGLALEPGIPSEGPTTWFSLMPAGSSGAVTLATATWTAAADIHFALVTDGGGPFDATGDPGRSRSRVIGDGNEIHRQTGFSVAAFEQAALG